MTGWIARLSVHRPVTVLMIFMALVIVGVISVIRIPLQAMPDGFQIPEMGVWVDYEDATPLETQNAVALPVEEQLSTIPGLRSVNSNSDTDGAWVQLQLTRSADLDVTYNDIVDRMERALAELPDEVDRYWIWRFNPNDEPIVWLGVRLPDTVQDPYHVLNDVISRRLERVPGVGKVEAWGTNGRRAYVDFSLGALIQNRVSLFEVMGRLRGDNFQLAGGRLEERGQVRYVRSLSRWDSVQDLRVLPISNNLVLGNVAEVEVKGLAERDINHIDGQSGAALAVYKESGANTVATSEAVAEALAELTADPRAEGASFFSFFDQGQLIRESVDNLLENAWEGALFAVLVLFLFLRDWRVTALISVVIPFSLLITVAVMYFTGHSLNLISLLGLMLAVGNLVDNAIVVVESIYARRQRGEDPESAAVKGTTEVGLAIVMSTLTSMVVFLPIILMTDDAVFSFFLSELGLPVVWVQGISLLVALLFTPLGTTLLKASGEKPEPRWSAWLGERYERALRWLLARRSDAYTTALVSVALTLAIPFQAVDCQGEADAGPVDFAIRYELGSTFNPDQREEIVSKVEEVVEQNREAWGVRVHRSRLSGDSQHGRTWVYLHDVPPDGAMDREEVIEDAKGKLPDIPGVRMMIGWNEGGDDNTLRFNLRGEDTVTLASLAEEVGRRIEAMPGVLAVHDELEAEGADEVRLVVDRQAATRYGLDAARIGQTVAFAMRGTGLTPITADNRELEVGARFRAEDRVELERLLDFPLNGADGGVVPLRAVVHAEVGRGYGELRREDRATAWPIVVDLDPKAEGGREAVTAALASFDFPQGYSSDFGQFQRDEDESDRSMVFALALSVAFVFLIMGVLFESFLLPFAVITTVPMALLGAWWSLYITDTPLDPMGAIGLVVLIGVIVNNGIVLVDLVTTLREQGHSREEAFALAGRRRLRPILMTALATIVGLIPMAVGDASFLGIPYAPMGKVLAGGMLAGTTLTLFFLPYLYLVLDDVAATAWRWLAWVVRRPARALGRTE